MAWIIFIAHLLYARKLCIYCVLFLKYQVINLNHEYVGLLVAKVFKHWKNEYQQFSSRQNTYYNKLFKQKAVNYFFDHLNKKCCRTIKFRICTTNNSK